MIWVVLAIFLVVVLGGVYLVEKRIRKLLGTEPGEKRVRVKVRDLPAFKQEPRCVGCNQDVGENPVEVHMIATLAMGKQIPVTVKICEDCVAQA